MPLTRANVEDIIIRRLGTLLNAVDLDGTTVDGSNADLNDPIGYAIRQCGQAVDDVATVGDADVARVSDTDKLLDIAELRTLETAYAASVTLVNIALGPRREDLSHISDALDTLIGKKSTANQAAYGVGLQQLSAGLLDYAFQEVNE